MGKIRVGASNVVITPPIGSPMGVFGLRKGVSKGINDDLRAKALVIDDGSHRIGLVSLDLVGITSQQVMEIRDYVRKETGIPEECLMVACSHTHTSPYTSPDGWLGGERPVDPQYLRALPRYVAGAVAGASKALQPCSYGVGSSRLMGITVNRRHPELPVDDEVTILRIDRESGGMMALVMNFPCHTLIVGGQNLLWTADFPGFACSFVEEVHRGSVCMFLNGASGDVHPWDWFFGNENPKHPPTFEEAERFGRILACEAIKVGENIRMSSQGELSAKSVVVSLPQRRLPSLQEAEELLDEILKREKPWEKPVWDPEDHICTIFSRHPSEYLIASAYGVLQLARRGPKNVDAEIQAMRLDDTILVSNPGEPFSGLGLEVKGGSTVKKTFVVSYANGGIGYIPTREAVDETSHLSLLQGFGLTYAYGTTLPVTQLSREGGEVFVSSTLSLIRELSS